MRIELQPLLEFNLLELVVIFASSLGSSGMGEVAHWIRSRSHQPWSQWKQLTLHPALCIGNALTCYSSMSEDVQRRLPVHHKYKLLLCRLHRYSACQVQRQSEYDLVWDGHLAALVPWRVLWRDPGVGRSGWKVEKKSQWQTSPQTGCFIHQTLTEVLYLCEKSFIYCRYRDS